GGYEKQYLIRVDPVKLAKHKLTFDQVIEAAQKNNRNVGGGYIRQQGQGVLIHGLGRTVNLQQIRDIQIGMHERQPITIGKVADVEIGHEIRRGAVTADGKGEVVLGLGFMLMGSNSHEVTWMLKHTLEDIKENLPRDVEVDVVYDRTELVTHVIDT